MSSLSHFLSLALLVFAFQTSMADVTHVVVEMRNGKTTTYQINGNPKVEFTAGQFSINAGASGKIQMPLADVQKFYYKDDGSGSAGIADITDGEQIRYTENGESIEFLPNADGTAQIYTIGGVKINEIRVSKGQPAGISLRSLNAGVYVVKINSTSFKIVRP